VARRSDDEVATVLASSRSVGEAARLLGVTRDALRQRSFRSPAIRELYERAAEKGRGRVLGHPGFIDMTGQVVGCLEVRSRAPTVHRVGNARWNCVCTLCGVSHVLEGIVLRSRKFARCPACRPKRPGRVTRRAHG
jgi:hypothetical protein